MDNNKIAICDCDWNGIVELLDDGGLCPRCGSADVEIDDMSFGFSLEDNDYGWEDPLELTEGVEDISMSYPIEDLVDAARRAEKGYEGQFIPHEEDICVITDSDIWETVFEKRISVETADRAARIAVSQSDSIIKKLMEGSGSDD